MKKRKMKPRELREIRKLERVINGLCSQMIKRIEKFKKGELNIEEIDEETKKKYLDLASI